MQSNTQKLGFWAVFALVTGSQIGSGIFMLPSALAPYGKFSIIGWLIAGAGAILLALVFAQLCAWFPKTGGPHVYVQHAFGNSAAFFTGWTYWVISWISTAVVVIAAIGYLTPLLGIQSLVLNLILEILLLVSITYLNLQGAAVAGKAEFFLTLLKIIPLIIIPFFALFFFNASNLAPQTGLTFTESIPLLGRVVLLTLWGFIGLESATTPAQSVYNPSKTIPKAIVTGTLCVALIYLINSIAIMGIIPFDILAKSAAPYAAAVKIMVGGNWHLLISLIACLICVGTLNAWVLTSGQIALGLANDALVPSIFGKTNNAGAPVIPLLISCLGTIPLLVATINHGLAAQVLTIIDFSVTAFLFVYAICCSAFLKIVMQKRQLLTHWWIHFLYGMLALLFCGWIIYNTPLRALLIASFFCLSGIPLYISFLVRKKS